MVSKIDKIAQSHTPIKKIKQNNITSNTSFKSEVTK